jgi:hypothetical protein
MIVTQSISQLSTAPLYTPVVNQNPQGTGFNASVSQFTTGQNEFLGQAQLGQLTYPSDVPKYTMTFTISQYVRTDLYSVGTFQPSNYPGLVLPLPQQLVDSNHVNWVEAEVGTLIGAGQGFGGVGGAIGGAVGQEALNLTGAQNSGLANAAEGLLGFSPNQFVVMLMRGPTYKRHRFTWDLEPANYNEANNLNQIITVFKNAMAPNFFQIGNTNVPVLWAFPKVFYIRLYPNSMFMYKFKPCVCDYFVVNYTPGGRGAFRYNSANVDGGNPPAGVQIQAQFIELEYWIEGNYSGAGSFTQPSNDPSDVTNNNPNPSISNTIQNALNAIGLGGVTSPSNQQNGQSINNSSNQNINANP